MVKLELKQGAKTIKNIIPIEVWRLEFKPFKRLIKSSKDLYKIEKMFLQLIKLTHLKFDIEIEVFLLAETYELTNMEFFGALKVLNPRPNTVIKGIEFKELFRDSKKLFEPVKVSQITYLLK